MPKLRIIISDKPKIMIISQDVHFDITRQCAQVDLKSINIFSKKNHLGSFCKNGKQFIQQDLLHKFVQFLA
jgi:peroxiredoxin